MKQQVKDKIMAANKNKGQVLSKYESGDKYGFLTLTGKAYLRPTKTGFLRYVECICVCGKTWFTLLTKIKKGGTKSCGCKRGEILALANTTHGMASNYTHHPIYRTWSGMIQRCKGNVESDMINYTLRGIIVYSEWANDFNVFHNGQKKMDGRKD